MIKYLKEEIVQMPSHRRLQFLLFLITCGAEALFIITEGLYHYVGYLLIDHYIMIPGLLFLGVTLTQRTSKSAKQCLLLSAAMVLWFVLAQVQHKTQGMTGFPPGFFLLSYLFAFPFASVTEDGEKSLGYRLLSLLMMAASLVLVGYSLLLILDCLPGALQSLVYWDGTRLHPLWHSNTAACLFMIGIGTGLMVLFQTKKTAGKVLLLVLIALQFVALALTSCRTSVLMTCGLIGSAAFFRLSSGGWKRFVAGGAAALVTVAVLFLISGEIYDINQEIHLERVRVQMQQSVPEETNGEVTVPEVMHGQETVPEKTAQEPAAEQENAEVTIYSHNPQGTFVNDLRTLNNRTGIWRAAFEAVRDNPMVRNWGTEYGGVLISQRNSFAVDHAHNSWVETMMCLGLPGLLLALVYTAIALWSAAVLIFKKNVENWKKVASILLLCILVAGFLEPYLFITKNYYHFIDFIFFVYLGYLDQWRRLALGK